MHLKVCKHCNTSVLPNFEGYCPACNNLFVENTDKFSPSNMHDQNQSSSIKGKNKEEAIIVARHKANSWHIIIKVIKYINILLAVFFVVIFSMVLLGNGEDGLFIYLILTVLTTSLSICYMFINRFTRNTVIALNYCYCLWFPIGSILGILGIVSLKKLVPPKKSKNKEITIQKFL